VAGAEQSGIEQHVARGLGTGERKRFFLLIAAPVHDSGIGGAGGRKECLTMFGLDSAEAVFGEHRALLGIGHPDTGEDGWLGAVRALRCELNIGVDQRAQWTGGEGLILFHGRPVDGDDPAPAAGILASRADAAEAFTIGGLNEPGLVQTVLLAAGLPQSISPGMMCAHKSASRRPIPRMKNSIKKTAIPRSSASKCFGLRPQELGKATSGALGLDCPNSFDRGRAARGLVPQVRVRSLDANLG